MMKIGKTYNVFDKTGKILSSYVNCTTDFANKLIKKCKLEGLRIEESKK